MKGGYLGRERSAEIDEVLQKAVTGSSSIGTTTAIDVGKGKAYQTFQCRLQPCTCMYAFAGTKHHTAYDTSFHPILEELSDFGRMFVRPGVKPHTVLNRYQLELGDYIDFHSDANGLYDPAFPIVSVSFGQCGVFVVRMKGAKEAQPRRAAWVLEHGDLLVMTGTLQQHTEHAVLSTKEWPAILDVAGAKRFPWKPLSKKEQRVLRMALQETEEVSCRYKVTIR